MSFLDGKKLEELQPTVTFQGAGYVGNLIDPTDEEKLQMVEMFKEGKDFLTIKRSLIRETKGSKLTFSKSQIKEVYDEWQAKILELTSSEE